ncbi:unnamed protein product [Choristocarpus tenellus]
MAHHLLQHQNPNMANATLHKTVTTFLLTSSSSPLLNTISSLHCSNLGLADQDFWTTRCTNCPAALDQLDLLAKSRPSVAFISVNIDDASVASSLVSKAASEGRWTR